MSILQLPIHLKTMHHPSLYVDGGSAAATVIMV
jgi:hypothetical protein